MVVAWTARFSTARLAQLFDATVKTIAQRGQKGIIVSAGEVRKRLHEEGAPELLRTRVRLGLTKRRC
jgi:hypothetical protein